jgi:DNA mismatch endonuclease (patch repair protein)
MTDRITKKQRSKNMAAVKSRGNVTTELSLANFLRKNKINGWRRHNKRLPGSPDFSFPGLKVALFTDGCFWHGCKKCYITPKSNKKFWKAKLLLNTRRDRRNNRELRKLGWTYIRIWEHEIRKSPEKVFRKMKHLL